MKFLFFEFLMVLMLSCNTTEHHGVFTHHDSFVHLHLIAKDESEMGHLDEMEIVNMKLYLPKK